MQPSVNTRISQWWTAIPFVTSIILIICAIIYVVCLLVGYDSFEQVCFLPVAITSHYEVYRPYTATLFHVSVLHLLFNMLALVPISSGLERILGSVRYSHLLFLIATSNGILHLLIAVIIAHNPFHPYNPIMYQCSIGFSGMIFAMIVMETSLSGAQTRSIFGLFNVPAKWYAWILLILFQILMPNVSLLGHLCGILSGFAYTYGLFNPLLLGSSTYSMIENTGIMANCIRTPRFIVGGGLPNVSLPTSVSTTSAGVVGNLWRNMSTWVPRRETPLDERFPGRGRTLAEGVAASNRSAPRTESGLQTRLLERDVANGDPELNYAIGPTASLNSRSHQDSQVRQSTNEDSEHHADLISNLVAMGFEKEKAEIAIHAAEGDLAMAVEILSSEPRV